MVHHVAWVSLVCWVLLLGACVALYLDARGARKALSALSQHVSGHDLALGTIEMCHHRKIHMLNDTVRQLNQEVGALNRIVAHVDETTLAALPSLVRNAWHAAHNRRSLPGGKSAPPVDLEGAQEKPSDHLDRLVQCCMARLEEAGLFPPPGMDAQTFDARVDSRYKELIGRSNAAGARARHCEAVGCCAMEGFEGRSRVAACICDCATCKRARELLVKAYREVSGREPVPPARRN